MKDFFFVLDQGTTEHKISIYRQDGTFIECQSASAPALRIGNDGLGSDIALLTQTTNDLIRRTLERYDDRLSCFGFANQGETIVAWDKITGEAISNAISWQCQSAQDILEEKRGHFESIRRISGLVPSAYFSAAKMEKLLRTNARAKEALLQNRLALGTLDTWMIWHWTRGTSFVTDPTTACRTQLYDTFQGRWSPELIRAFNLREEFLPKILTNDQCEITCDAGPFVDRPLPLLTSLCDQPAALIGHGGLENACLKATFGTGAFVDLSYKGQATPSDGLLTSVLYADGPETSFYLEGGVLSFASAIAHYGKTYGTSLEETLPLLSQENGIFVLPALAGLGAPHFRSDVTTLIEGADAGDNRQKFAAVLRGLIFRVVEIVEEMARLRALPQELRIDGGLSQCAPLMQFLADAGGLKIIASENPHVTADGVAKVILKKNGKSLTKRSADQSKRFLPQNQRTRIQYREWKEFVGTVVNSLNRDP